MSEQRTHGTVEYINPEGMHKNPAFTQVVVATNPVKTVYIGMQNAVSAQGEIVGKGDIAAQTEQVMTNIQTCLDAAGAKAENIVIWTIYVQQGLPIFPAIEVGMRWWGNRPNPPANNVVFVPAFSPPDFLIGIEVIAVVPL
ncbi:MAG TPA: RidA family protein [Aggregatilineales bacterium]|nr:RidA family protein [Aggregatilineales bacterium]